MPKKTRPTKKPTKKGRGKAKGSAYERAIAKRLSLWVTDGERDDVFWRTAMSGGKATVMRKAGKKAGHMAGDLCAVRPEGIPFADRFFLELKHYKNLGIAQFFLTGTGLLHQFWLKAKQEADAYNKYPMLIFRQSHPPIGDIVLIDKLGFQGLLSGKPTCIVGDTIVLRLDEMVNYSPWWKSPLVEKRPRLKKK